MCLMEGVYINALAFTVCCLCSGSQNSEGLETTKSSHKLTIQQTLQ